MGHFFRNGPYEHEKDNLLWNEAEDFDLLSAVKASKAEVNRLTRERSEDAVSWNVFRCFHRLGHICEMLHQFDSGITTQNVETIFWLYSDTQKAPWSPLLNVRVMFGEARQLGQADTGKRVSEPDLAFVTDKHLVFVEAKFGSGNATSGNPNEVERRVENPKNYILGGNRWYDDVSVSEYDNVVRDQKYELLRFWLLGSWIAQRLEKKFLLVNLVRNEAEKQIEQEFGQHIKQSEGQLFARWTWESLGPLLQESGNGAARRLH
jgi:hypothetical protein